MYFVVRNEHTGDPQKCPEIMEILQNSNACRICLEVGAMIPIFENELNKTYKDTLSKMNLCFGEVPDLPGYPRHLCLTCYNSLDEAVAFLNKYKESCKVLEENLGIVIKTEISDPKDLDNYLSDPEVDIHILKEDDIDIKVGLEEESSESFNEDLSYKLESPALEDKKGKKSDTKLKSLSKIKRLAGKKVEDNGDKVLSLNTTKKATSTKVKETVKKKIAISKKKLKEKTETRVTKNKRKRSPNPAMCELCGKSFNSHYNYRTHKSTHFTERPHKCPMCSKSFSCSEYLKCHIRKSHEKRTYICADCGKVYTHRSSFILHIKASHLKIKKKYKLHPCTICDKKFILAKYVLIHERSAHTGERPAVCKVCNASFYHEDYLAEHMRLHTGETPYKCPICDKGFAQRGNMKSHMRHNHSISKLSEETLKQIDPKLLKHLKP